MQHCTYIRDYRQMFIPSLIYIVEISLYSIIKKMCNKCIYLLFKNIFYAKTGLIHKYNPY